MVRLFCLVIILFIKSNNLYANTRPMIISGFDDVLRQAENTGLVKSAIKIFEKDKTFSGMPELYSTISGGESVPKCFIVSAISSWFESRIQGFLKESGYPENRRYLRNWLTDWSIEEFKISRIEKIIHENPGRKFIVIFDNSNPSIEMATILHEKFGDKIQAIYLRQVVKKETPAVANLFFTAFDIAMNEYATGRFTLEEAEKIARVVIHETQAESLIPSYALCPTHNSCKNAKRELVSTCQAVNLHLNDRCRQR